MTNKIITLRDRLARGGIEGRVFVTNQGKPYEAKGIVMCDSFGRHLPYLLTRHNDENWYGGGWHNETWGYKPLATTFLDVQKTDVELPPSQIPFKRQVAPEGFSQATLDSIDFQDDGETSKRLKRIFPMLKTVQDLLGSSPLEIRQPKGMGDTTVNRIIAYLGQFGVGLRQS